MPALFISCRAIWFLLCLSAGFLFAGDISPRVAMSGSDRCVSPDGSGDRSGKDWDNAASAAGLQGVLDAMESGHTLFLGSGIYQDVMFEIRSGGESPAAMKRIIGTDTGGGLPVFQGSLEMENVSKGWQTMVRGMENTCYWELRDIHFKNCSAAVKLYGGNVGIRISGLEIENVREGISVTGMADASSPIASRDLMIFDCRITHYTKRAVRIRDGVSDVRISRIMADAGGKDWYREDFPIGFHVDSGKGFPECRDISFIDCSASGNWHPNGKGYWNGDGFAAERNVRGLVYLRCFASNNTDGGWDDKSANPLLVDCVSMGNKRNFRLWSNPGPAVLRNCASAYPVNYADMNPGLGMWLARGAQVAAEHCTFYACGTAIAVESDGEPSFCQLTDCLIAGAVESRTAVVEKNGHILKTRCIEGTIGDSASDPLLEAPSASWRGGDKSFNSRRHPRHGARFSK